MLINITIEEAKEIICDYITKHYKLIEPDEDPLKAIKFIKDVPWGVIDPDEEMKYFFTAWVELEGLYNEILITL